MGYGTGAIMAVPGHDTRDFAFARAFELPIRCVVEPTDGRGTDPSAWDDAFVSYDAKIVNSDSDDVQLNGLGVVEAKGAHHRSGWSARGHRRGHRQLPAA